MLKCDYLLNQIPKSLVHMGSAVMHVYQSPFILGYIRFTSYEHACLFTTWTVEQTEYLLNIRFKKTKLVTYLPTFFLGMSISPKKPWLTVNL